jgi:hypothetical protein
MWLGRAGTALGLWLAGAPLVAARAAEPAGAAVERPLRSLAVLDVELVDDQNTPTTRAATEARLPRAGAQLRQELAARHLYRIVDVAPARALQQRLREQQDYLYRCADCAEQVGRLLGVDLVMAAWVQKVSELILNFNVEVHEVATQRIALSKSVDLRGNQDDSWARAVRFLVRDMAEKRERNPGYAQ